MRRSCQVCQRVFEREYGFFLGAMMFSYFLGAFSTVPTLLILFVNRAPISWMIGLGCLQVIVLAPFLFRYSRLGWIYIDYNGELVDRGRSNAS